MNAAKIIVETYTMGTLMGDVFLDLQLIFQNWAGDMGATSEKDISLKSLQVLYTRGFVTPYYNYDGHFRGYRPSDRALRALHLENAQGAPCMEPRDAFDCRLVVDIPEWIDAPSGLGVSARVFD